MVINEKDVGKNVGTGTSMGVRVAMTTLDPAAGRSIVGSVKGLVAGALCAFALSTAPMVAQAREASGSGAPVTLASLPREAQQTHQLIAAGGPFPYSQDGVVFANREGRLERHSRGYYHEYTVPTPGARNRGAQRIVCGGEKRMEPDACFYTEDHYNSFHRILK